MNITKHHDDITIFGLRTVEAFLMAGHIRCIFINKDNLKDNKFSALLSSIREKQIPLSYYSTQQLSNLVENNTRHQGIVALTKLPTTHLTTVCHLDKPLVILDGVTDPRNLGAIMRTALSFDVSAIIVPKHHSSPLSAVAIHASCGAAATLPLLRVTNIARTIKHIRSCHKYIVGVCEDGEEILYQNTLPKNICWILGDEGKGIRFLTRQLCDFSIRIPTANKNFNCLNVSSAFAICMSAMHASN